ncbi:unnamed protein product, partial [Ectocarpus sp. 12 AP-2014]
AAAADPANGIVRHRQDPAVANPAAGGYAAESAGGGALALRSPSRPPSVMIERSEIVNMALAYTSCAGCSAAVKGLLQRPMEELRLVNAVVEEYE